jgi:hypothetical protein
MTGRSQNVQPNPSYDRRIPVSTVGRAVARTHGGDLWRRSEPAGIEKFDTEQQDGQADEGPVSR